jgi:DNA modification methylase
VNLAWDKAELESISDQVEGFDVGDFGFEIDDLPQVVMPTDKQGEGEPRQEVEEDDFDEEKEHVEKRCETGDIWQLGAHRLCCGDSTSKECVSRLMGTDVADMVFTDPPYGIAYGGGRAKVKHQKDYGMIMNDDLQGEELGNLICNVFEYNKDGADVYICVSPIVQKPFLDYLDSIGKKTDAVIVWDKRQPGLGYMAYRRQCEFILFIKGGKFHMGDKSDVDLWSIGRDDGTTYVHGTQKPVGVSGRAIQNSSKDGDIVLDYFGGSGSTLIACEKLNRQCRMMELDTHFCDVIIARWEKLTGQKAIKLNQ